MADYFGKYNAGDTIIVCNTATKNKNLSVVVVARDLVYSLSCGFYNGRSPSLLYWENPPGNKSWSVPIGYAYEKEIVGPASNLPNIKYNIVKDQPSGVVVANITAVRQGPKNNDGRSTCAFCPGDIATEKRGGGMYDICPKCGR